MSEPGAPEQVAAVRPVLWSSNALTAVCIVLFVLSLWFSPGDWEFSSLWRAIDSGTLVALGGLSAASVWIDGEWWRVGSAAFLHGSLLHLLLNMVALRSVGQWCEVAVGSWWSLAIFGVSALWGSLASLAWSDGWLVVGASGGVFGVAGALVVLRVFGSPTVRLRIERVSARSLSFWLALWLVVGGVAAWAGWLPLAQGGHVGGLLAGVLMGLVASARSHGQRVWRGVAVLSLGVGSIALAVLPAAGFRSEARAEAVGYAALEAGRWEVAVDWLLPKLELRRADPGFANDLAYALALAGTRLELALELASFAVAAEPENPDFLDTLGWVHCRRGEAVVGVGFLADARELAVDESLVTVLEHLEACGRARVR